MIGAEAFHPPQPALVVDATERASAWSVDRIEDERALDALAGEWRALLGASDADELFVTPEWLATWWRVVGSGPSARLAVVAVRHGSRLAAVAPFERRRAGGASLFAPPTLRFLGGGRVGSDYLDVVARAGEAAGALLRVAEAVEREGAPLDLRQVASRRSSSARLADILRLRGWQAIERVTHVCPYVELEGHDWTSFVGALGASHRANLRRRLRKLEERFEVRFGQVEDEAELDTAFATLLELHDRRWATRGGSDGLAGPELIEFHREFCRVALARGWLRLQRLELDGRTVAALYGFRYGDRFLYYQSGFDPAFAEHSVGLVCLALSIRSALEEGASEYDLLHGEESYKGLWASAARELVRIELFPPSFAGRLRYRARRSELAAKRRLKQWLARGDSEASPGPKRSSQEATGEVAHEPA